MNQNNELLKGGALTANPNYPVSAEAQDCSPVAADAMVICRWCHFMVRFGRGETQYVQRCNICELEGVARE